MSDAKNAVILFTRVPLPKKTKTRLLDFLSPREATRLHAHLIGEINLELKKLTNTQIFVFFTPKGEGEILREILGEEWLYHAQSEGDLAIRMLNAFKFVKLLGFEKILLLGSDIVNLRARRICECFDALDTNDVVIDPTLDGGYALIGLKEIKDEIFSSDYSDAKNVYKGICAKFNELNLSFKSFASLRDIDTKEDIFAHVLRVRRLSALASGEYNINYKIKKRGASLVFRINTKSQIGLKHQVKYEFDALKVLESSGVTPKAYEYFAPSPFLPRGAMSMEFLPGRALDYRRDLKTAAQLLVRIHSVPLPKKHKFLIARKPLAAMMTECGKMARIYHGSKFKSKNASEFLSWLEERLGGLNLSREISEPRIINTELNSGNFLINEGAQSYVIDWEKPIVGEKEQDLAHFLAPTTTFWKTDVILNFNEMQNFLNEYEKFLSVDRTKFNEYLAMTCFRGLSWCAMAYTEYQGARAIKNAATYAKIKEYLSDKFLSNISIFLKDIS
ncbi:TIGR04282 family arsenosugar biosynthesis glycosyltransferase [Campylobacter curvus]|uniref:TIGR04282 family arsenosugar biosynthesis glycosyltransferase n=1 Tax=Campylobacter curvus TaxID=200 RepID=UPI0003802F1F|nr:TIGR04282 family arsenosugar biosynthesis glycosyltransferase [Campylobacter curvus]QKF62134.1 transferase 1, rSAM/selenodomain-associated [Campylobacter curvus]UEB50421.1 TIGR04282 family arsenosugar biosynthesis glycosyltransferase [Campylobacter curvus]